MSEDGVRTEKCKKYQVTALSTAAWGLRGSHVRCMQLAFCSGSLLTFFHFFAVSFKAVFWSEEEEHCIHDEDLERL